ncbi:MAG: DnaJ domain-containing protein [Rhodocyclaceae bacterium]|nr:DnaJ domain-containing protein [Rhodocyclaceae bacterium]
MEFRDYYQILGVEKTATADEIRKAYRKLARKYHPDVSKEPDAEKRMREINEANAVLSDPEKRLAYDQLGSHYRTGQEFQPPPGWDAGFEFSGDGAHGERAADFSDFFASLFGHAGAGRGRRRAQGAWRGSPRQDPHRPCGCLPRRNAIDHPAHGQTGCVGSCRGRGTRPQSAGS